MIFTNSDGGSRRNHGLGATGFFLNSQNNSSRFGLIAEVLIEQYLFKRSYLKRSFVSKGHIDTSG